jgi:alpha-D-xyloside xylohydrolase
MKVILVFLSIVLIGTSCSQQSWSVEEDGLTLYPSSGVPGAVRLTLIDEDIVKVEISATKSFDTLKSLIAVDLPIQSKFNTHDLENEVVLETSKLQVKIDKKSGAVRFFDTNGKEVLSEDQPANELFNPITVDGVDGYELRQKFRSTDNEALYGLGQHQADEMNYKGKNEELFQYNTKVSVPFVVSTGNYGILWDNYSLTRFGDARPYSNLDQFTMYNKNNEEGGLSALYIDNKPRGNVFTERVEKTIDYENLETISAFPDGFDFNNAKITWEGYLEAPESGVHKFLCYYAGYTKLWIDGDLQFDNWRTAWNPSVAKFDLDMKAGNKYHLKLEWIPDGGVSYIGLKALSPIAPEEQKKLSFYSEMGQDIRYYFIAGDDIDGIISGYRTVSGKAQVMPKWSMGFWQSRERYKTEDELLNVLGEFRKRQIPIDNIVLDWSHWSVEDWGSHQFDPQRFPDPEGMIRKVHDQNARIMISVWPKFYHTTEHYRQFDSMGWMYKKAVEDSIRDWIYPGYIGSFYDAYSAGARKLFWEQIKDNYYEKGIDAWWLDATEPDILSNASIEYRKELMNPTALGPATQYFNAYALQNAKGIYEGQRSLNNNERVFILTRSGFAGIQRYGAVTWSGDIGTRWEDMKSQISAGINFAMSGLPYWTMDIGGFCVEKRYENAREGSEDLAEWRELNTRWFQFGAFVPLFRSHGQLPFREVYNIAPSGHPAYESMLYYNKLRYRLMPYIYSLAGWTYQKDYTIMRGLAMDFADDQKVWDIGDQYMFGPSLLICPVYEYKERQRMVYLPASANWYRADTGKFLEGGQSLMANAPYETMPVYIKAGSIIPFGPEIEFTTQKQADPLTVFVYTGANADFDLYEDEGTNYNYENGAFSIIPFEWSEEDKALTVGEREGQYEGMLDERKINVVFVSRQQAVALDDKVPPYASITYNGTETEVVFK